MHQKLKRLSTSEMSVKYPVDIGYDYDWVTVTGCECLPPEGEIELYFLK